MKNNNLEYKNFLMGRVTKKSILIYLTAMLIIYGLGILVSASIFPGGFSFKTVYISYLGGNENNPSGYHSYNISVFITGIMLIPIFSYIYQQFKPDPKLLNQISLLFGLIGCIGFSSLSIFHQGAVGNSHRTATLITFGGLGASALFTLVASIRKICLKQPWPKIRHILVIYGILFSTITIILLFTEYSELFASWNIDEVYFGDRFWEWFYLLTVIDWIVAILVLSPSSKLKNSTKVD